MTEPIERRAMFGWRPGMGMASVRMKGSPDGIYGVREWAMLKPSRRDMERMFPSIDHAREYAYHEIRKNKGAPTSYYIYRFRADRSYGTQYGTVHTTNRNRYHTIEIGARFVIYTKLGNYAKSRDQRWYLNRDGSLGERY